MKMLSPPHPGRILKNEICLQGRSVAEIANHLWVDPAIFSSILSEQAAVTPEMSRKLAKVLNTPPDLWYRLQEQYDEWRQHRQRRQHQLHHQHQ